MTNQIPSRIAVFIDAENVTSWIKQDGISQLLEELKSEGQLVIRRAYGVWSRPQLAMHQATINQQGFELIHCYHPVSGKNTADIQMAVDVIECAWQLPNINCFVLVTGDSDFSPVFRRLRQMDKKVIGVGQHSALSECVKTSCTRLIYTDSLLDNNQPNFTSSINPTPASNTPLAQDIHLSLETLQRTIKQLLQEQKEAINSSKIKSFLLMQDSRFNEKKFGFASFTDFLKAIEDVTLNKVGTVTYASLTESKTSPSAVFLN